MRDLSLAFALAALPLPALAHPAGVFVATLGEKDSGFATLAECEQAIARPVKAQHRARIAKPDDLRGSLFNRAAGNTTHCEMIDGEALMVVIPKGI